MPCRPASHEFRAEDGVVSRSSALALIAERRATSELLLEWATDPATAFPSDLKARVEGVLSQDLDDTLSTCPTCVGPRERERVGEWAMEMAFRADREEKLLCEARCVLARVARALGTPPAAIAARVTHQLAQHRAHRIGDRNAVRAEIEGVVERLEAAGRSASPDDRLAALRQRLAKLDGLTDAELLEDREALNALWP